MVNVTVTKAFRDLKEHVDRKAGETFEATEERAAQIDAALPGYISIAKTASLSGLTVSQLRAQCAELGIDVPKGAKKADLVALLQQE